MNKAGIGIVAAILAGTAFAASVYADDSISAKMVTKDGVSTQEGAKNDDGKWMLPDGSITYKVQKDDKGFKVDWFTYNGFRRYHAECHVCHGPDGEGSSYAPRLADSLKKLSYSDFLGVVASGRVVKTPGGGESVMPAFGDNKNVMCYVEDLYTYLKARADGALPRGRLGGDNRDEKPKSAVEYDKSCFGG